MRTNSIAIVDFDEALHRDAFRDLNVEWISRHFTLEEADRRVLDDPVGGILSRGGHILMAVEGTEVLGTCALISAGAHELELAKMAVAPAARGRGVGELLGRAAIERAAEVGAHRVELLSNTVLEPAIRLYRKLGFREVPLGSSEYRRANIRMVREVGLHHRGRAI